MERCPRCGSLGWPYKAEVNRKKSGGDGRVYLYYAHKMPDGKRRICYIGPVDGYELVARMYDVDMQHAFNLRHRFQVFTSLLSFFVYICGESKEDIEEDEHSKSKIEDICREFRAKLREALREMEGDSNE